MMSRLRKKVRVGQAKAKYCEPSSDCEDLECFVARGGRHSISGEQAAIQTKDQINDVCGLAVHALDTVCCNNLELSVIGH
jgi:hypothetical protein